MFYKSSGEQKYRKKVCGSKLAFKEVIAVYVVQNETMVAFLELFERGNLFWDIR